MTTTMTKRPAGTQRSLELQVSASQDVLVRVLGLLHRRRCRVTQVDYVARDRDWGEPQFRRSG